MTDRIHRFAERLADERGMALVMAVGVSFVLAIIGASVILFTTSNERHSNRVSANTEAYSIAQGGIDSAVSQLGALDNLSRHIETNYPCTPAGAAATPSNCQDTVDAGSVSWTGELVDDTAPSYVWRFTSTSSLSDPSNPGGTITRTVTADVALRPETQINPNTDAWRYVYSRANDNDPNTCDQTIMNNPAIISSFYVNGDLCLDNSSNVYGPTAGEPAVDVVVKGRAYLNHPSTSLGTSSRPLTSVEVGGGCKYRSNPLHAPPTPCTSVDRVWPDSIFPGLAGSACEFGCPVVTPPSADLPQWYIEASPGPMHPCEQSTGTPPVFDTDTTRGNHGTRIVDLAPASSYTCETPMGKLNWDQPTRTLTVEGTVFFDASVDFSSDDVIQYNGMGAIYASGSLRLRQTIICGLKNAAGNGCDPDNWDAGSYPSDVLVFVTNGTGTPATSGAGMTFEQSSGFQGALYANAGNMTFENNTWVQGPMIAEREVITNSMYFQYIPLLVQVPFGAPGTVITRYALTPAKRYTG
jgi:Tfp pilus assembly protein PilX